ncbi:hypothetical protein DPMN_145361 [Dreissena polymorpha]|uniref:Uncharacterized protein n=1 Tax=Dreissena polymorpha TaxID=45954 RepID=A0A9D4IYR0_DREPO|nr:hypothetical protein DPMN_145361 [Dreissena polymorpha]
MLHLQDKSLYVDPLPILSYRWIMREKRNWQFWLHRKMDSADQSLFATTPSLTR